MNSSVAVVLVAAGIHVGLASLYGVRRLKVVPKRRLIAIPVTWYGHHMN